MYLYIYEFIYSGFGSIDFQLFYDNFMAIAPLQAASGTENKNLEKSLTKSNNNVRKNILSLLTFFMLSTIGGICLVLLLWITKNIISKYFCKREMNAYSYVHIKNDYGSIRTEMNQRNNTLIQERNNELI